MIDEGSYDLLNDPQRLQQIDAKQMLRLVDELPEQCETALGIGSSLKIAPIERAPNAIVIIGAGECVVAADMLRAYLSSKCSVPILAIHQPSLPACVQAGTVVVILDYNLKNPCTRSAAREALEKGAKVLLGISTRVADLEDGGKLRSLKVPPGQPERSAIGYRFVPAAVALHKFGLAPDVPAEVSRAILHLKNLRESYRFSTPTYLNPAKQLARQIAGTIPVIYGPGELGEPVADRWRNQICFNAKSLACSGRLPDPAFVEVGDSEDHKGLPPALSAIILGDPNDPLSLHLAQAAKDLTGGGKSIIMDLKGANLLERMWHGVYLADYVSCYLALIYGVDPWTTARADTAQERLDQWDARDEECP